MRYALIVTVVGLVTYGWSMFNRFRDSESDIGFDGNITPGKISALAVTIFGIAIAVFGIVSVFEAEFARAIVCSGIGFPMAIFMAPSITHLHDVRWDSKEVNGPCRLFGLSLGLSRTSISWDEIKSTGKTITGYWFIQSRDGRRVYWSYLYPGYGRFVDNLLFHRPSLKIPDDLR